MAGADRWLAELPALVADLGQRWSFTVGATLPGGTAAYVARVRTAEVRVSFDLIELLLPQVQPGEIRTTCAVRPSSCGLGWVESSRGSLYYAVHIDAQGRLARVKIKSPSFSNWRAFPFTVHGSNMMDYAINEASFGLTIAGCDR